MKEIISLFKHVEKTDNTMVKGILFSDLKPVPELVENKCEGCVFSSTIMSTCPLERSEQISLFQHFFNIVEDNRMGRVIGCNAKKTIFVYK